MSKKHTRMVTVSHIAPLNPILTLTNSQKMVVTMEVTLEAMMAASNEFRMCDYPDSLVGIELVDGYWLGLSLTTEMTNFSDAFYADLDGWLFASMLLACVRLWVASTSCRLCPTLHSNLIVATHL